MTLKKGFLIGFIIGFIIAGSWVMKLNAEHMEACAHFWKSMECIGLKNKYCIEWNNTNFTQPWTSWDEYAPGCIPRRDFPPPKPNITVCQEMLK